MINESNECTFLWFIENYSYCSHKTGDKFLSPEFTANGLGGTSWNVGLYPKGITIKEKDFISIYLNRREDDDGPEELTLKYELTILTEDKITLESREYKRTFKKGIGYGWPQFLHVDDVILRRMDNFMSKSAFSVSCKMWNGEGVIQQVDQITARTQIGIKNILFSHITETFSELEPNQKRTIDIKSSSKNGLDLTCDLYFTDDSWCEGKIIVEILPIDSKNILSRCKLSVIDKSGKLIQCSEACSGFNTSRKNIQKLPLSLTRPEILNRKEDYLQDGKLSLLCECTFSTGVQYENIETILHEIPSVALNQINKNDQAKDIYNAAEKLAACPDGLVDLKMLYNNQLLTDVELKTKTKSFPAHKIVLCARSSVFKAMLTNDMREKNTDCIQVDDLEDDVMQQFLLFLYSDQLKNLVSESAIKLYYAGDKYAVEKLKVMCASFLLENLSTSTASEVLLLADTHNDSDLKKAVEDFIFKHEEEVFGSDEWGNLMETNPLLVSRTVCQKYRKKV